jgi:chromate transporter
MGGIPGAASAIFGLCLLPVVFILVMGYLYFHFKEVPKVKGSLHGASAAAVAMTLAMVIKTGQKCLNGVIPVMLFAVTFILNGLLRWPLPLTLAIVAPLGLIWAWPRPRST